MKRRLLLSLAAASIAFAASRDASALTREEVMVRARAYAIHRWSSTAQNQTASCSGAYKSLFPAGDYVGLPYDWGGYMSLFTFDQQIAQGLGAGSQEYDGVLACTTGVDCSGYVSSVWGIGHNTTSSMPSVTSTIAVADLLPGDVFNKAGYHVAMFTHKLANGEPALIEAAGYNVHFNTFGGLSYVNGYTPRRHASVTGTTAGNPLGTTFNPIVIGALPYADARNTALSPSTTLDGCAAAPASQVKGPEYVYQIEVKAPGTLTASVTDDAATDVDIELLQNLSTAGCVARHDSALSAQVGCGTYWIVVDTFGANASKAGPYNLNVDIAPSGQACGAVAGPPKFDPKGKLGDACAYPGNKNLPFCNPNINGADTCIYGNSGSFCSTACGTDADCTGMPGGGCCQDLGKGEKYCMTKAYCGGGASSSGLNTSSGASGASGGASGTNGSSSGASSGGASNSASSSGNAEPGGEDPGAGPSGGGTSTTTESGGCNTSGKNAASWLAPLLLAGLVLARGRRRRA